MDAKILLVDNHQLLRDGLHRILKSQSGYEIVGEARDGNRAAELARELEPDIVLLDAGMPGLDGPEAARQILEHCPRARIVALSIFCDATSITRMLQAGARAYVLKEAASEELGVALRHVQEGRFHLSNQALTVILKEYLQRLPTHGTATASRLSPKERDVLQLIAAGATTKQIALRFGTSVKTIETHRRRLMDKLGLDSVAALTKFAIREGLTEE